MSTALALSPSHFRKAIQIAKTSQARLANMRAQGEAVAEQVISTGVSAGTGYLLGLVNGAGVFKDSRIGPVPLELASAILFNGLRLLGVAGKYGRHIGSVADASLACFTHVLGMHTGLSHWGQKTASSTGGDLADRLAAIANA